MSSEQIFSIKKMLEINSNLSIEDARMAMRFRKLKQRQELSSSAMGKMFGVSASYIKNVITGRKRLSTDMLRKWHQIFEDSYDYILEGKE